jgi:hypothetical protein
VLAPVVVTWLTAPTANPSWATALRVGFDTWLLGDNADVVLGKATLGFSPLGLTLLQLLVYTLAARRLARELDPRRRRIAARATLAAPKRPPLGALVSFATAAAFSTGVVAALAVTSAARPVLPQAVFGSLAVAGAGALLGAAWYVRSTVRGVISLVVSRAPEPIRSGVAPALTSLTALVLIGTVVVLVRLTVAGRSVLDIHQALGAGSAGGAVLILAQLMVLPNLAVWAVAAITGPGFAVGAGSSVTLTAVALGVLPAVPVLGALPAPGVQPDQLRALYVLPVIAGMAGGLLILRDDECSARSAALRAAVVSAVLTGLGLTLFAWLSGGSAGPGRLAVMGPVSWQVGLAGAGEVLLGTLAIVAVRLAVPAQRSAQRPTRRSVQRSARKLARKLAQRWTRRSAQGTGAPAPSGGDARSPRPDQLIDLTGDDRVDSRE